MNIHKVIATLKKTVKKFKTPIVGEVANSTKDPFRVLISCVLSLRTKDKTTAKASRRLFSLATTPQEMRKLPIHKIIKAIYPVGFYRVKAENIKLISKTIIEKYDGNVPSNIEDLVKLKGVGRKTANLVVTLGYNKYGICVDTHVHRISNRLGFVKTKTPYDTEMALRKKLPKQYWKIYNDLLVVFGQNVCKPISPFCSVCEIKKHCPKIGVKKCR